MVLKQAWFLKRLLAEIVSIREFMKIDVLETKASS